MPALHPPSSTVKVEVPEASVDRYLSQGWRKAGASASKTKAKSEPADAQECDVCGFEAKTPAGLAAHSRKHDEE